MPVHEPYIAEANRLYWETDDSVASIADRLDVSRRALYEAVRPISSGMTCESCGGELAFENRSARKQGMTVCPACDAERRAAAPAVGRTVGGAPMIDGVRGDQRIDAIIDHRGPRATGAPTRPLSRGVGAHVAWGEGMRDPDLRHRAVVLGSVAIAGVAVGTMAAIFAMRREG